jgi:cell shape-determining protein MreC
MTTISPKRKRTAARIQIISFSLLAVVVLSAVFALRQPFTNLLWWVGVPVLHARDAFLGGSSGFFASFASNRALVEENNQLRAALASTSVLLMDRELLYKENVELKSKFNRIPPNITSTLVRILLRPPAVPYDTLVIDQGKNAGIKVGDLISPGGSVYIGTVREVYDTAARVVLFSSPGETYDAILMTHATTTLAVSVSGQGGGSLVSEVPAATAVGVGDLVIFPGLVPEFAARVVAIKESRASFKTIYLQLPVSVSSLRFVEVRHMQAQ